MAMIRNMQWMAGVLCLCVAACGGGSNEPTLPDVHQDVVETVMSDGIGFDTTAPTAPSQLKATYDGVTSVDLTWLESTDDMGVAGYKVFDNDVEVGTTVTATFRHDGLVVGSRHCYRVKAYDLAGNVSDLSKETCLTLEMTTDVIEETDTQEDTSPDLDLGQPSDLVAHDVSATTYKNVAVEIAFDASASNNAALTFMIEN